MTMLMRTDPFRELERWTQQLSGQQGTRARPAVMPMDAYRVGEEFIVAFDLPGVDPALAEIGVQRDVLSVKAERTPTTGDGIEWQVAERPTGVFSRQLFLGETLDTEHIEASYDAGMLTLRIPVAEQAKPRKIPISAGNGTDPGNGTKQLHG
jgi:HSP20 family protein